MKYYPIGMLIGFIWVITTSFSQSNLTYIAVTSYIIAIVSDWITIKKKNYFFIVRDFFIVIESLFFTVSIISDNSVEYFIAGFTFIYLIILGLEFRHIE